MESIEEIKKHLRTGDYIKVAAKSGLSVDNVRKTLQRPKAKKYNKVVEAAREIAEFNTSIGL